MMEIWIARLGRRAGRGAVLTLTTAVVLFATPVANAATVTNAWQARIGSAGVNGTATINAYTTGSGAVILKLARLKAAISHTVVISKGSCGTAGATIVKLAAIKASSSGAAARTSSLTVGQVNAIKTATRGTGKVAIRIAYGSTVRCGVFAAAGVPPNVAARITVGRSPSGVAVDASGVWVTNWWDNTLSRINPATNTVLSVVPVDFTPTQGPEAIGTGAGSLWVTATEADADSNPVPGVVKRIDPASGATLATIPVGKSPFDIDVSAGAVWVANYDSNSVMRIDPATNQVVATISVLYASGVTVGLGAVWVVGGDGMVTRIDPVTNQIVTTIPTQASGAYIATGNGAVWVTHPGDPGQSNGSLSRIDPATNLVVANTPVGANPQELAISGANIWIGMLGEPTVVRVSASTNAVLNRVVTSAPVYAITAAADVVWAVHNLPTPPGGTEPPSGSVSRITGSLAASVAPTAAPRPTPSASPTPTPSSGGTLVIYPYFMVGLPAGWSEHSSGNSDVVLFAGPGRQAMAVSSIPTSLTLEQVTAQVMLVMKGMGAGDPEHTEAITIDQVQCTLLTFQFAKDGSSVHELEALCVRNGRAFEIDYANVAGTETADRTLFLDVLHSFSFAGPGF